MALDQTQDQTQQIPPTGANALINSDAWNAASTGSPAPASNVQPPVSATPRPVAVGAGTPPITQTSPNVRTHSFVARAASGLLSALAGEPGPTYTTDGNGKLVPIPAAPQTTGQKLRRLLNTVGTGLSAPDPGPQKSGLASILAGLGAGYGAESQRLSAEDKAARDRASQDFERNQQNMLHKMELAKGNALLYSTYKHLHDEDLDKNEEYKVNKDIAQAFEDEKFPVRRVTGDQLFKEFNESPKQLLTEGRVLLTGERAMTTSDGQAIVDPETQQPRYERMYAIVDGMHEGKIKAPHSFIDYVKKYAPYASGGGVKQLDSLDSQADQDLDAKAFYRLHNAALEGMKNVVQAWGKPEAIETPDGKILQRNPISGETKDASQEQIDAYQKRKLDRQKEAQEIKTSKSTETKNLAEADKAKKDSAAGPVSNLTGEDYLKTLPTARRGSVQAVGEGRQVLPANRKEALAMLDDVHQAYPDYDEGLGKVWQKTRNEYMGSGKTATLVVPAYNTALAHMEDLYTNTTREGIFNPLSKAYQDREVALGYVAREVGKAVSAGALTQKESEDLLSTLKGGLTPSLKRERITKTAQLLHDKIDEYQTKFNAAAPSSAVRVPVLISPKAAAAYDFVTSGGNNQASSQSGQTRLPQSALSQLKEGVHTTFGNGQTWTLQNGQPMQVPSGQVQ
jgi:hypothetical protein